VLAGSGTSDPQLREASDRLARRVAAGDPLAAGASEFSCFPATFVQAMRWEKHAEAIPQLLRALADMFQAQTKDRATAIAAVCEPVIIVLTAGLLGFMVVGLFLPLITLISNLSG
jgi:type IV pilus assembly protein PilC